MKISSHNIEFGYELIGILPTAYYHYLQGTLTETESGKGSEALYYFSPKHKILKGNREYENKSKALQQGINVPNVNIHKHFLDLKEFAIPPYKKQYKNNEYKYKKPTLCICNRYNYEWGQPPINYFDLQTLSKLIELLQDKYQIVYFGVDLPPQLQDQNKSLKLGDYEYIKKNYKDVIIFQDIVKDWNETMLKVFTNCEHYITMNGGYSILSSYFGGKNIIYSKKGLHQTQEINYGSFQRWYGEFGNSQIVYVDSYDKLLNKVKELYVVEKPTINILVRTAGRENYLKECINSIEKQTYSNINIIIGCEKNDKETMHYLKKYNYRVVFYEREKKEVHPPNEKEYGVFFPANGFLNDMIKRVNNGWIIYLDDDDCFINNNSVSEIVEQIKDNKDVIFWRTKIGQRIIPSNENFGSKPVCKDITSNSFCHHVNNKVDWGLWKRGDYRVSTQLYKKSNNKFIDQVFTAVQDRANFGERIDKTLCEGLKCLIRHKKMGEVGCYTILPEDQALAMQRFGYVKIIT